MQFAQGGIAVAPLVLRRGMAHLVSDTMKEQAMQILTHIQKRIKQRAAYLRTKSAIEAMPLDVAIDLDIYKPDAAKLARKAVYAGA